MPLIDHLSVGVPDIAKARQFYDPLMDLLGVTCLDADDEFAAYGTSRPEFLLLLPFDGQPATSGNGTHIAFVASSPEQVAAFHESALANGGTDEGASGPRDFYPMSGCTTAYVRDPFGNKLEVLCNGFSSL
ncbi:VOC family protein [Rhodobacteraceae bacterium B1Z28]|uniref:VOC family protein n=1 Tax=Ruegeria haliotis TaxID=2747601 RepID=A0ABX2PJX8_9RHOB|nr:VOC family protein [Ruegeria haliotis]NVO54333.1 VOC family protein [Ruegeria haliotis]